MKDDIAETPVVKSLLTAAESYARRGWRVFPIKPRTKNGQLLQSWSNEASADVVRVRQWWKRWPDANIGIACGPSRLLVVDLDGDEGRETWEQLSASRGIAPSPLVSVTGSGGRHLIYALPDGMRNTAKRLGPGIDTRAEGGYIVAPPSIHPTGNRYAWADVDAKPAACPVPLADLLTREPDWQDPWASHKRTFVDMMKPRPPVAYVVEGWFAERSVNMLYTPPGALKTMIALDLALATAGGEHWLADPSGNGGFETKRGKVVILDLDSGEDVIGERLQAMARARGITGALPIEVYSFPPRFDASDEQHVADMIARCMGAVLIIVDTLSYIKGGIDSNSDEMTNVMQGLRSVATHTGAAVLILHHQRKESGSKMSSTREGDTIRGSSAIEAGLDSAVLAIRDEQRLTLKMTKNRRGVLKSTTVEFVFTHKADGQTLDTARFWPTTSPDERQLEAKLDEIVKAISESEERALSENAMENAVGGNKDALRRAREYGVANGRLIQKAGSRKAKMYSIAPDFSDIP